MKQPVNPIIEARSLSCDYAINGRHPVLYEADLALHPGELVGLIGPNGAGKTTLLKALARLLPPQSGQVLLNGQNIWQFSARQVAQQIAQVPQSANAAWPYTVKHIVRMGRYPHRGWLAFFNGRDAQVVENVLARLDLLPFSQRTLNALSGGEQQRVLIARALAQEPSILLLDEPVANLDINYQHQTLTMIKDLVQEFHLAVLITIHDLGLAARYCHRLVLLNQGKIIAKGSPTDVLRGDYLRTVFGVETQLYRDPLGQWALSVLPLATPTNGTG